MDTTGLMVGDWVITLDNVLKKVTRRDFEDNDFERYFPIPLTLEILERNGFEIYKQDFTSNTVYKFGSLDYMEYEEYHKYFNIGCMKTYKHFGREITYIHSLMRIRYVHELQHALKLCGIDKTIEP